MEVRIAYFVMAHHRPDQLEWLISAIDDPRDIILLHVDRKSMLGLKRERKGIWAGARKLARERANLRLLPPRFTNWGGWSLSRIHLDAIDLALEASSDWTHFVNLSGQCYPIKAMADIRSTLAENWDRPFIEMRKFESLPGDDWHLQWHPMIELPHKALKLRGPRRPPDSFELNHKGSQWSVLPRGFCEWQRSAVVAQEICRYLSGLFLSDELIMQTLVQNSPWRDLLAQHRSHEVVWPGPKVMRSEDLPFLTASPALFARKFDVRVDRMVVAELASRFGYPLPASCHGDAILGEAA